MARIGIALSGGGHRAALFGLGALLYFIDAEKNREVTSIASVSGGSLTNGYMAQAGSYRDMPNADLRKHAQAFAHQIATRGTVWACMGTWVYLFVTATTLVGLFLVWRMPWHLGIRTTVFAAGIAVWHKILAEKRGAVCSRAFRRTLFTRNRKSTLLKDVETGIDHVLCATDLHAGEHVYFAGSFVYSYRFGLGKPAGLPLATAVQVSAAFPGAFAPRVLKTAPHEFDGTHRAERTMVLTDGGVYDNMAEQWAVGLVARNERFKSSRFKQVEELVVVNSSATMPWHALGRLRLPLVGEVFALAEIVNTLYDNTTSPRRSALVQRFDEAAKSGIGLRGALVTIDQTPYTAADYFVKSTTWPDRASRANAVLTMLQNERKEEWERITDENRHTATTFGTFGTQRSAQLIYHAYVVAMMNLHIVLDYPLLPMPTRKEFEDFVS